MGRMSLGEIRSLGVSQEDIDLARATQQAQRRSGAPVQSIAVICGLQAQRKNAGFKKNTPTDFNSRALRRGSKYDQAALLLDQQAMSEADPERAMMAREASKSAKNLSLSSQLEFDFFKGGNVTLAHQYQDAINHRLLHSGRTQAQIQRAKSVLWDIVRHLSWQSYECQKSAADLCEITQIKPPNMASTLQLLEEVGAIRRIKRGRTKIITVTPEGAYRGVLENSHADAVERYRLEVIEGGKSHE